jgi:hypothetical protein
VLRPLEHARRERGGRGGGGEVGGEAGRAPGGRLLYKGGRGRQDVVRMGMPTLIGCQACAGLGVVDGGVWWCFGGWCLVEEESAQTPAEGGNAVICISAEGCR